MQIIVWLATFAILALLLWSTRPRPRLAKFHDVLCCCEPGLVIGRAPEGLDVPMRAWYDSETGETGTAYVSGDVDWKAVPGFMPGKRKTKRSWKKIKRPNKGGKKK